MSVAFGVWMFTIGSDVTFIIIETLNFPSAASRCYCPACYDCSSCYDCCSLHCCLCLIRLKYVEVILAVQLTMVGYDCLAGYGCGCRVGYDCLAVQLTVVGYGCGCRVGYDCLAVQLTVVGYGCGCRVGYDCPANCGCLTSCASYYCGRCSLH